MGMLDIREVDQEEVGIKQTLGKFAKVENTKEPNGFMHFCSSRVIKEIYKTSSSFGLGHSRRVWV
jgi:hypothetical protein